MASLFDLKCEMENFGADYVEGASETTLREQLEMHKKKYHGIETSSISTDVAGFTPSNFSGCQLREALGPVQEKFGSLLRALEKKNTNDEARNIDVFVLGYQWGQQCEDSGELHAAETFYTGALSAGDCPTGRKALSRVYGKRNMIVTVQQFLALLLKKLRRFDEAEQLYFKILDTPGVALAISTQVLHQLSNSYAATGNPAKLKNCHKRWKKLLSNRNAPEDSLIYCQCHESMATFLRLERNFGEAIKHREQIVASRERAYGVDSWLITTELANLARLYCDQRDFEKAHSTFERAFKSCSQSWQPTTAERSSGHPLVRMLQNPMSAKMLQEKLQAQSLAAMGDVRAAQGRDLEALALFERAFALNYDKSDGNIGMCMHNWGQVLLRQGRLSEALGIFRRASAHQDSTVGPGQLQSLVAKSSLGEALLEAHHLKEAKSVLESACSLALANLGPTHMVTQEIVQLVNVAKISIKTSSVPFSSVPFKVHGPGEVLTDSDFPWADLKASCEFCKKKEREGHKFQVCSKCKRVKYCSVGCQKEDWKKHKKGCRALPV